MQDEPQLSDDGTECTIYTETAWGEPYEWRQFIERKIDGLCLYYLAIEPGCGVYCSNDDQYADKYYVDNLEDGSEIFDEEKAIEYINKHFEQSFETIEECMDFAEEYTDERGDKVLWINPIEME